VSRSLGNNLPSALLPQLDGRDLAAKSGLVFLICTVDARGYPHPAMLSVGEVLAPDPRRVFLALYASSTTSNNLRRGGQLTLALAADGLGYYVKATARELSPAAAALPGLAAFEATVDEALEDGDPIAAVTSGFTIALAMDPSPIFAQWESTVAGLRTLV
jgi:hypothetical protein